MLTESATDATTRSSTSCGRTDPGPRAAVTRSDDREQPSCASERPTPSLQLNCAVRSTRRQLTWTLLTSKPVLLSISAAGTENSTRCCSATSVRASTSACSGTHLPAAPRSAGTGVGFDGAGEGSVSGVARARPGGDAGDCSSEAAGRAGVTVRGGFAGCRARGSDASAAVVCRVCTRVMLGVEGPTSVAGSARSCARTSLATMPTTSAPNRSSGTAPANAPRALVERGTWRRGSLGGDACANGSRTGALGETGDPGDGRHSGVSRSRRRAISASSGSTRTSSGLMTSWGPG